MPRIRNVKPEFFTDADLGELSPLHRLLFQGLWCHADRDGRLEDRPKDLKIRVLPFDEGDVDAMLGDLAERGFIARYEADGERYIAIPNFARHQKFHRDEKPRGLPPPPDTTSAPSQHPAGPLPAPCEQGADTLPAPSQHPASTPDVGRLTSEDGRRRTEPPPAPSAGVALAVVKASAFGPGELQDRLLAEWQRQRGASYAWNERRDGDALRQLLSLAQGDEGEILRRWSIALATTFPRCRGLADLARDWNAYARPEPVRGGSAGNTPGERLFERIEQLRREACEAARVPYVAETWAPKRQQDQLGPVASAPAADKQRFQEALDAYLDAPENAQREPPYSLGFFLASRATWETRALRAGGAR